VGAGGALGLDLARFDADRRSDVVRARVERSFRAGIRGGVVTTPTVVVGEQVFAGRPTPELWRALGFP
jgi:2-hydroxychromene-2-carboxylate isomerase